jgi:transcription elongation GreA/GreB family factor
MKKQVVFEWLCNALSERERALQSAWDALMESNQQEGKSSSGDKHETGRAMVHLELEQLNKQRQEWQRQKEEVWKAAPQHQEKRKEVRMGSLVTTNKGLYYMVTGWGKAEIDGVEVMIMGAQSPAGRALMGKRVGDAFGWGSIKGEVIKVE